jgi:vesicle-associated membrane protein 7
MGQETAFSFLGDLKRQFLKLHDLKTINSSFAYKMKDFNDEIKGLVRFYEENPSHSKTKQLIGSLYNTTDILRESVEMLLDRNEKLNIIAQKSKNLKDSSYSFRNSVSVL